MTSIVRNVKICIAWGWKLPWNQLRAKQGLSKGSIEMFNTSTVDTDFTKVTMKDNVHHSFKIAVYI